MNEGDKVTFIPYDGAEKSSYQRGIVKSVEDHGIFVVFNCNDLWSKFRDYGAELCNEDDLQSGWL